jgi:hypothetical protein
MCFGGKTAWARVRPTLTGLFQIMPRARENPGFVIMMLLISAFADGKRFFADQ